MSPRPPVERIRRPQILAAAAEVIAERGVAGTRIADIAERAGTSPPSVLYWFRTKDDLLTEALTSAEERFAERMSAEVAILGRPSQKLLALLEHSVTGDDWVLWIEVWTRALRDLSVREARQRLDDRWREFVARIIEEGTESGEFAPDSVQDAALALAGLIDGLAVQVTLGDTTMTSNRMLELCIAAAENLLRTELRAPAPEPSDIRDTVAER